MELYTKGQMQNAWYAGWIMGIVAGMAGQWMLLQPDKWLWVCYSVSEQLRALFGV